MRLTSHESMTTKQRGKYVQFLSSVSSFLSLSLSGEELFELVIWKEERVRSQYVSSRKIIQVDVANVFLEDFTKVKEKDYTLMLTTLRRNWEKSEVVSPLIYLLLSILLCTSNLIIH